MFIDFVVYTVCYFILILFYFKFADRWNIIDKPNERSSHSHITIVGAGILFPIAFLFPILINDEVSLLWKMIVGLLIITVVSFVDDMMTLKNKSRLFIHTAAVTLLIWQSDLVNLEVWYLIPVFIIVIVGVINAYNFMDGINGITALYSLVALGTLFYISQNSNYLLNYTIFISLIASLVVFSFFNLRKKAKCFCGDVGSISIAFILSFLLLQLIDDTGSLKWVLLLGVYGLDTVATIGLRIKRRENIFDAHRSHFYQYLVNDKKISHVTVSVLYAVTQMALNYVIISQSSWMTVFFFSFLVLVYIVLRLKLEGKKKLFISY